MAWPFHCVTYFSTRLLPARSRATVQAHVCKHRKGSFALAYNPDLKTLPIRRKSIQNNSDIWQPRATVTKSVPPPSSCFLLLSDSRWLGRQCWWWFSALYPDLLSHWLLHRKLQKATEAELPLILVWLFSLRWHLDTKEAQSVCQHMEMSAAVLCKTECDRHGGSQYHRGQTIYRFLPQKEAWTDVK